MCTMFFNHQISVLGPVIVVFPFTEEETAQEGKTLSQQDTGIGGVAQAALRTKSRFVTMGRCCWLQGHQLAHRVRALGQVCSQGKQCLPLVCVVKSSIL